MTRVVNPPSLATCYQYDLIRFCMYYTDNISFKTPAVVIFSWIENIFKWYLITQVQSITTCHLFHTRWNLCMCIFIYIFLILSELPDAKKSGVKYQRGCFEIFIAAAYIKLTKAQKVYRFTFISTSFFFFSSSRFSSLF